MTSDARPHRSHEIFMATVLLRDARPAGVSEAALGDAGICMNDGLAEQARRDARSRAFRA